MTPAPYKVSNPKGADRIMPVDGTALRRESWILGQCPDTYNTSNNRTFKSPSMDTNQMRKDADQVLALRQKVAGTSIKNECPNEAGVGTMYKTNSSLVHNDPGKQDVISKDMRDAQRKKLTKASFMMGKAPNFYNTNNKL